MGSPPQYFRGCNDTGDTPASRRCQDLDSSAFAVKLAHHIWSHTQPPSAQLAFYHRWSAALERGMNATTKDPSGSGLLWSNTSSPTVGYGFQVGDCCLI